ncbi:hypothetical protein BBK82_09255 [Lentzea guizhouensis]|uniref:Uncharacterized protein n=1 Tax=Lentzea guizhouensis TaxID=1586287 RepID=A0A1B2HES7_9PSEU|nr:hypothetical protein BBK82_09255 [Lentzea guizhouensis]
MRSDARPGALGGGAGIRRHGTHRLPAPLTLVLPSSRRITLQSPLPFEPFVLPRAFTSVLPS